MDNDFVADDAAVDEEMLAVAVGVAVCGQSHPPPQAHAGVLRVHRHGLFEHVVAHDAADARRHVFTAVFGEDFAAFAQGEVEVVVAECKVGDELLDVLAFGALAFQEFFACRGVVEKVVDVDGRADGVRRGAGVHAEVGADAVAVRAVGLPAGERGFGYGGDAGQGFAAKAQGAHVFEVFKGADFAGRMGGKSEREIVGMDARTVITHHDAFAARRFDVDVDVARACVNGVFHDFFDDGCRSFDDFAGGYLVDEVGRELADTRHGSRGL